MIATIYRAASGQLTFADDGQPVVRIAVPAGSKLKPTFGQPVLFVPADHLTSYAWWPGDLIRAAAIDGDARFRIVEVAPVLVRGGSKLTAFQVAEMRHLWEAREMSVAKLAMRYGIHTSHVYNIINGLQWTRTVTPDPLDLLRN